MQIRGEYTMIHEAGDIYFLELLCGLASADGAALLHLGVETQFSTGW
jgi:hypothetical protein